MIAIGEDYKGFYSLFNKFLNNYPLEKDIFVNLYPSNRIGLMPPNTPFACNPIVKFGECFPIFFDDSIIQKCKFTENEEYACIMHEIGHLLNKDKDLDGIFKEITCDNLAVEAGLSMALMNALIKMYDLELIDEESTELRINNISKQVNIFRPEWLSGRYDMQKKVAISYNLVEGMSYFFEAHSSVVISYLLELKRNTFISLEELSKKTGIHIVSLVPFVTELINLGLVTTRIITEDEVLEYRHATAKNKHTVSNKQQSDSSDINFDDAENEYSEATNGVTSVMFELTYRCSEQCIHCYNIGSAHNDNEISRRGNRTELSLEQYKHIIDQLCEKGMFRACLTGGDPFANKHVWEIMEYLKEKNVVFDVFTNGQQLMGNEHRLAKLYPKTVGISIYSAIPNVHDSITRIKGSLEKSLVVMENLSKLAIPMYLKCCVMKTNFNSYNTVYEVADKYSALAQIEVNVTDSVEGNKYVSENLRLSEEQYNIVLQDSRIPLYVGKEGTMRTIIPRGSNANLCKAGKNTFNITPDGKLIPCCRLHLEIGDLKVYPLADILAQSSVLNDWLSLTIKDYEDCGKHDYCDFCNVCPGLNYSEHGDPLKAAENACFLAKIRYNMAIKEGIIKNGDV